MNYSVTDNDIDKLIFASVGTAFRTAVEATVDMRFRSIHYKSSKLICDCIVANLLLNEEITVTSADYIILRKHKECRAFYTSVDSAYFPIEDRFKVYAKNVLKDGFDAAYTSAVRATNFIVYVLSVDLSRRNDIYKDEIILKAYSYEEIIKNKIPRC